jgi:hypothetical protein
MAALTLAHVINLWEIIVLATLQGLINAFDMPARQSFLVQMVINARVPSSQRGIITNRIFIPNRNPWPIQK